MVPSFCEPVCEKGSVKKGRVFLFERESTTDEPQVGGVEKHYFDVEMVKFIIVTYVGEYVVEPCDYASHRKFGTLYDLNRERKKQEQKARYHKYSLAEDHVERVKQKVKDYYAKK